MVSVCLSSCNTYHLTWVSLTLDVGYLFTAAPAKHSHCSLPWMRGISSLATPPDLESGVAPLGPPAPWMLYWKWKTEWLSRYRMVVSVSAVYHVMMRLTGNWACCHLPDSGVDFLQHIASQGKDQNPKLKYNFYQKCISLHYHKVKKNQKSNGEPPTNDKRDWGKKWQPNPVFLLGKSHGQRSLAAMVHVVTKESDKT